MTVSVIIPLHNSKKYLSECLDSILRQTLRDIEIICVDSSIDGTTDILYQYKKIDSRIQIIEDKNSSYGYKLNIGIRKAKGKYIAIVESDDYIADDMLETLYDVANRFSLDFVKSNFEGFLDIGANRVFCPYRRVKEQDYNRIINLKEEVGYMLSVGYNIWTGIYRTEFLKSSGIEFHESSGASYQDVGFSNLVTMIAQKTYFLKECFYKYRMDNENSSVKSDEKYRCIPEEFLWLKSQMKRLGCNNEINDTFLGITRLNAYYWNYLRVSEEYRKKLLSEYFGENIGEFDESLLNFKMPKKEHIIKVYKGDIESLEQEAQFEKRKKQTYKDMMDISHKYARIIIVCCGSYGQAVYHFFKITGDAEKLIICDNFVHGELSCFDGKKIISILEAVKWYQDDYFIIANKMHSQELQCQIEELGIAKEKIFICDCISSGVELLRDFKKYCIGTE